MSFSTNNLDPDKEQAAQLIREGFKWYNLSRLTLSCTNIFLNSIWRPLYNGAGKIPWMASLVFGIELLYDLGMLIKNLIWRAPKYKGSIGEFLTKFFLSRNRWSRMINAAVWFTLNFIGFFVTSGISAILTAAGLAFDVIHGVVASIIQGESNPIEIFKVFLPPTLFLLGFCGVLFAPGTILVTFGAGLSLSVMLFWITDKIITTVTPPPESTATLEQPINNNQNELFTTSNINLTLKNNPIYTKKDEKNLVSTFNDDDNSKMTTRPSSKENIHGDSAFLDNTKKENTLSQVTNFGKK